MNEIIEDKTIIKKSGIYFQYDASTNSWIRLDGYKSVPNASTIRNGIMSKDDYQKVQSLLTAPPKTTLTSDQCSTIFTTGSIRLFSGDNSVIVEDYLDLYTSDTTMREQWRIHEDTWGFNFKINLDFLIDQMRERNNLIETTIVGVKGIDGDKGNSGIDRLDTGPQGLVGETGTNAPFDGALLNTSQYVLKDKSRVVVDVEVEEISPEENYLVIKKGIAGVSGLCTRQVNVQNENSSLVLARSINGVLCSQGCFTLSTPCKTVYFDIEVITDKIKEHVDWLIAQAKADREAKVANWLNALSRVFNDQKHALCCAIENCQSRQRNKDERRYIESQRIAAAAANYALDIGTKDPDGTIVNPDANKQCDDGVGSSMMDAFGILDDSSFEPTVVIPINPI
jgi:hypothetical protein